MHRQIDLKSLLSEILKTVQKNGKNVMEKYFKIFSKKFSFRENTEAATPQFSSAKPNRNLSPGLFFDRVQCAHGQQYPIAHIAGHEHIAPGRKKDPGSGFDWAFLKKIVAWPHQFFPKS